MKKVLGLFAGIAALSSLLVGCGNSQVTPSTLQDVAQQAVKNANLTYLGSTASDKQLVVKVETADNFTMNMMREGVWLDSSSILKDVFKDPRAQNVELDWYAQTTNNYGKTKEQLVEKIDFSRKTANKVDWDNVPMDSIPKIADSYWIDPGFANAS